MGIPDSIDLGFWIREEILWSIDLPVEIINIDVLAHNMDIPYLESWGTNDRNLSPRQLIENFSYETYHANQVQKADISYPIEIYYFKNQRIILDGVHRYTKLVMSGVKTISVRKVPQNTIPLIKRSDEEYKKWRGVSV